MEVGVRLPNAGPKASPENILTTARLAERLGFHSLWVTDRVMLPRQVESVYPYGANGQWDSAGGANLDPLLTLAWAGSVAPSLKLGTSVLVAPLRHPVLLAKQLSALDYLSGGRVILGIGVGWMKEEFAQLGVPFHDRGKRTEELVQVLRVLWSGETADFHGHYWSLSQCRMAPRPVQSAIPVVWGGHSDVALRRVALLGDGWHPTRITIDELREGMRRLRQFCHEASRDPELVPVIVRPGATYRVTAETHAQHLALGVQHLVIDTPVNDPSMANVQEEMHRVAEVCSLRPRA